MELRQLGEQEQIDWLRLLRSERVGPATFRRLLDRFGTAAAALDALPALARRGGVAAPPRMCSVEEARRELEVAEAIGARVLALCEPDYPQLLRDISDPPPILYVVGDPARVSAPAVAIVGTRNASINGRRLAQRFASELGQRGYAVVSGLARGIDTAAHAACLNTGTVAVVAGGVDVIYPAENGDLYRDIAATGAVISEVPPGTTPQARHFPRRNRLISGVSLGVIVVEAALRSGALITARMALEQGRDVFAVPGSPLDPRSRGPNDLLRQGAILAEDTNDVLEALAGADPRSRAMCEMEVGTVEPEVDVSPQDADAAGRVLAEALSPAPATVDELVRTCQLSPAVVTSILLEWELAGRLERLPGNRVALVADP